MKNPEEQYNLIKEAIEQLGKLESRTNATAQLPHQYIGTIVDNTIILLTAPASIMDNSNIIINRCDNSCLKSSTASIHRLFIYSLHVAVEKGMKEIVEKNCLPVENYKKETLGKLLNNHKNDLPKDVLNFLEKEIKQQKPYFNDYAESLIKKYNVSPQKWRKFLEAFNKTRALISHGAIDGTINERDKKILKDGGLHCLVGKNGNLEMNPEMYLQFTNYFLDFFDEVFLKIEEVNQTTTRSL